MMARGKKNGTALTMEERLAEALVPEEEQPYRVLDNWCWVYLPHVCKYMRAGGDKPHAFSQERTIELNVPVVANGIQNEGIIGFTNIENEKAGTVTVSGRGTIRYPILREYPYYPVVRLIVLAPNTAILPNYLKYVFFCLEEEGTGSSIPQLTIPMLKSKPVPVAPLTEQQRIVDRIEFLFTKLDEVKEKVQSVLDSFETRKAAILYKAFTGELTAKWRAERSVSMDSWQSETLQSVCSMKITDGTHKTPTYCDSDVGVPFVSAKDVTGETIRWDKIKYIVPELHEELYARLAPQLDDVLLAKNGTTGVAAIVDVDKVFDLYVTLAVLRPDKSKILPRYLLRIVNSPVCKNRFDEHLTGIGVPNLHLRDIKEVVIQVPSLAEQAAVIHVVDSITKKEHQVKETAEAILEQIDLIKKAILARAFRGELGTNDPTEESAVELLKSVLA